MAPVKKVKAGFVVFLIVSLSIAGVCHAGDVPEALLHGDHAMLFFGKIVEVTDTAVTILPVKNLKGEIELNTAKTFQNGVMMGGGAVQTGKTYLIGYIDENNLYFWATDSLDPRSLKIINASNMDLRLQAYLNNGDMEEAEEIRKNNNVIPAAPSSTAMGTPMPSSQNAPMQTSVNTDDPSLPANAEGHAPVTGLLSIFLALLICMLIIIAGLTLVVRGKH